MALLLWNATENVHTWFHRLASSNREFTFKVGLNMQVRIFQKQLHISQNMALLPVSEIEYVPL